MKMTPKARKIAESDKKAIIEAFKGVDPSLYRLQFNNGTEVYGNKKIQMRDIEQIQKVRTPGEDVGWIVFVVEKGDIIYALAVSGNMDSVLGAQKAANLRAIKSKYVGAGQMKMQKLPQQQQMQKGLEQQR
jgi:hypothetical protein